MTKCGQNLPDSQKRLVVIAAFDGVTLSDIAGISDVLDIAATYQMPPTLPKYQIVVVSMAGGLIKTSCGISILTEAVERYASIAIDTLIVPGGGPPTHPPVPSNLVDWLKIEGPLARRLCAVCTGSFLVAEAGLADHKRLTTHWHATSLLQQKYPDVQIEHEPIFVRDGALWSTAGFSAGVDMALALLEDDVGYTTAMDVARLLVVFLKRPADQSQQSRPLSSQCAVNADFGKLHAWIMDNLAADLSVEMLAEHAGMTPRTFARRYVECLGRTPAKTVELFRIEAANQRLSDAHISLKQIARECGFGNEQQLRRAYIRQFGFPPKERNPNAVQP
ncbi:DJ-1/PfpI family protein [Pseudomonas fluorescens]|uniref:GlxA family transcriptional regulator n=1 Tax=Pseudomonas fluorescens TaxID=294 RepID=UPI002ACA54BF|nr:helix-turn-helix domain-containing protein [Pseudomonas fluorescens]MDZ5431384.1 DJ-1/PfpI family protein [Pseudomonas fluorescens]